MVDKRIRPSASRRENSVNRNQPRRRIPERPVAPEPSSPYHDGDETNNNIFDGSAAPARTPRTRLELLHDALQDRPQPQPQSTIRRCEVAKMAVPEDVEGCSLDCSSLPSDNEDWDEVASDVAERPVSSPKNQCLHLHSSANHLPLSINKIHTSSQGPGPPSSQKPHTSSEKSTQLRRRTLLRCLVRESASLQRVSVLWLFQVRILLLVALLPGA